jgi:hypothetical protein
MVVKHLLSDRNVPVIGHSNLNTVWNLGIGTWDLRDIAAVMNGFNRSGLLPTLKFASSHPHRA